jgi:phage shock protein PspC (stress-responsive transcriptional regulator)
MSETQTPTRQNDAVKRLERSRSDRMLAGVCGGLARYFDIHPAVYRVGFVVLTLLGGAGIVIYIAAALVVPNEGQEDSFATRVLRDRRDRPWPVIGLGLVAIALASWLAKATVWPQGDAWFLLLVLGAAILWITRHSRSPQADATQVDATALAQEDSRRIRRVFKGIAIAFATLLALLLVGAAVVAAAFHVHLSHGVGDRSYVVTSAQELQRSYSLGVGTLTLDLREAGLSAAETQLKARVDVGELRVLVPAGLALRVKADAQVGQVDVLGRKADGHHANRTVAQTGAQVLVLDAHVGLGKVRVLRAVG